MNTNIKTSEKHRQRAVLRDDFEQRISAFEQCVDTPLVPGEMENWLQATETAYRAMLPLLKESQRTHEEEFAEIMEEDPGLSSRVEGMREENRTIVGELDRVGEWLKAFPKRMIDGAAETEYKEELDDFVSLALDAVTRIRKQEVAVRTWLMEAFMRDRGTVD